MPASACFLQIKAFGDFVIAAASAERVSATDRSRLTLAIGRHLAPLCEVVAPSVRVVELDTGETGVPSIFDVRRNGVLAAARSAWRVRRALAHAPIEDKAVILLDTIAWREHMVIAGRPACAMPPDTPNIYEGYDRLLTRAGFEVAPSVRTASAASRRVGIFPGSRIAAKNMPVPLVAELLQTSAGIGRPTELFLLQGERPDLEASGLPHVIVPRQFSALRDAIASTSLVFSADSLPAHLAETMGIDAFVLTPRPNPFWMPRSVFVHHRWSLFDDDDRFEKVVTMLRRHD